MRIITSKLVNFDRFIYHDPRGKIIFLDDFEDMNDITARWQTGSATSGTNAKSNTYATEGQYSMKITTGGAATNAQGAKLLYSVPHLGSTNRPTYIGFAFEFILKEAVANVQDFQIIIRHYDGDELHTAAVKWIGTDTTLQQKWQYLNSSNTWTNVTSGTQEIANNVTTLHWAKLVVDLKNEYYVRLLCDDKTFSLASTSTYTSTDAATKPRLEFEVLLTTETATAISVYIDQVLISLEEKPH